MFAESTSIEYSAGDDREAGFVSWHRQLTIVETRDHADGVFGEVGAFPIDLDSIR